MKNFRIAMKSMISLSLILLLFACATTQRVHQSDSVDAMVASYSGVSPVPFDSALTLMQPHALSELTTGTFFVNPSSTQLLDLGSYQSPAILVSNKDGISRFSIKSYVVKPNTGALYLFYPILTLLDKDGKKIAEALPTYEFDFSDNVLNNEFALSQDAEYILIHTSPEFTGMVFSESEGSMIGTGNSGAVAIGAVLGGAIGGAIAAAASSPGAFYNASDFVFSIGGAIRLELE